MRVLILAVAAVVAVPVAAATVYKTVDAAGNVGFSDQPPPAGIAFEAIQMPESQAASDSDAAQRLQQMRETTDRMRADRLEREQARAARPPVVPYARPPSAEEREDDDRDVLLVPYYPPYDPWHHGHRPHPRPPYAGQPAPNPESLSPEGLKARLRAAR